MNIEYDIPIEVTAKQYSYLMANFGDLIAGRSENGKYYIKVWRMKFAHHIVNYLMK